MLRPDLRRQAQSDQRRNLNAMTKQPNLYWHGGPFQMAIKHPSGTCEQQIVSAICRLEEFRSECQTSYFAYFFASNALIERRGYWRNLFDPVRRDNTLSIGTGNPESPQLPGKSTIGKMRQGAVWSAMQNGGMFQNQLAKSLIVTIYHLWDDNHRSRVATHSRWT